MSEFICPHCGEDLRKVGIYENAIVSYAFVDGKFVITESDCLDGNPFSCSNCYEDMDLSFESNTPMSRKATTKKTETRYGNVVKEDCYE